MNAGRWGRPITYETQRLGQYRTIGSATEALRALSEDWPTNTGDALTIARAACQAALDGDMDPEAAREAFLQAADEADVFIR